MIIFRRSLQRLQVAALLINFSFLVTLLSSFPIYREHENKIVGSAAGGPGNNDPTSYLGPAWDQDQKGDELTEITSEARNESTPSRLFLWSMGLLGTGNSTMSGGNISESAVHIQFDSSMDILVVLGGLFGSIAGGLLLYFGLLMVAQRLRRIAGRQVITIIHKRRKFEVVQRRSVIPKTALIIRGSLGEGNFGSVDLGVFTLNKQKTFVAVKKTRVGIFGSGKNHLSNEIEVLLRVGCHPNVVRISGYCCDATENMLLLERCGLGDLHSCLPTRRFRNRNERFHFYASVCLQVAKGMKFLVKSLSLVHRDLCGRNILLNFDGVYTAKIADFGLALTGIKSEVIMTKRERLPWRILPLEAISGLTFSLKTDVWSFGMLMYEVFSGGILPFSGISSHVKLIEFFESCGVICPPYGCPTEIVALMHGCCQVNANNRLTWLEIIVRLEDLLVRLSGTEMASDVQSAEQDVVHCNDCGCSVPGLEVIMEEPEVIMEEPEVNDKVPEITGEVPETRTVAPENNA